MQQQREEVRWAVHTDDRVGSKNYALCCFFRAICLLLLLLLFIYLEVFKYYYLLMLLQQLTVSVALISRRTVKKLRGIGKQIYSYLSKLRLRTGDSKRKGV